MMNDERRTGRDAPVSNFLQYQYQSATTTRTHVAATGRGAHAKGGPGRAARQGHRARSPCYDELLRTAVPFVVRARVVLLCGLLLALALPARPLGQGAGQTYTVYTPDGQHALPFHTSGNVEVVSLDQLAQLFDLTVAEDSLVGGLTVRGRGQTILLIPGQSFASIGPGRIVSLPSPIRRERGVWNVPVDFIQRAIGPALNLQVEIRRPSHVILVGNVRFPRISGQFDRQGANGRLVLQIEPATPHRVSRQNRRLTVHFDAVAIDLTAVIGLAPNFVTGVRVDSTNVLIELGPGVVGYQANDSDPTHLTIDLLAPAPPPPPPAPVATPTPAPAAPAPQPSVPGTNPLAPTPAPPVITTPGTLQTVVIDPGHGGDDTGVKGPGGTTEKNYVLQFARRLKSAIEGRIGLRVLLTRDRDENVPLDRRAALANNNKADLFISLHANGSLVPDVGGAEVLSLRLADYQGRVPAPQHADVPVAVLGGGTRSIEMLPWELAQIGFTNQSAAVAAILARHLRDAGVPLYVHPTAQLPLRPLVGVSMPAVMVELGFLSNPAEERAMNTSERSDHLISAMLATINEIRTGVPATAQVAPQ